MNLSPHSVSLAAGRVNGRVVQFAEHAREMREELCGLLIKEGAPEGLECQTPIRERFALSSRGNRL